MNHASAEIRQAPGWWPSLVQVVCPACGYRGRVYDLNKTFSAEIAVRIERDHHVCDVPGYDEDGEFS